MRAVILGLGLVAALAGHANAEVFGLKAGQAIDTIPGAQASADDPNYYTITPPKPDAAFQTYKVYVYPTTGLCEIDAYGPAVEGVKGAKAAVAYQVKVAAELDKAYGEGAEDTYGEGTATSTVEDDLLAGNISLQRAYNKDANKLPKDVSSITLFLQSEDGIPQVSAAYYFNDEDACLDARNAAIDASGT